MSAQGGTITGRPPVQLPIRPIAVLLAVVTAAAIGMTAIRLAERDAGVEPAASVVEGYWNPTTGHPAIRDRSGEAGISMPVQRLYPDGFSQTVDDGQTPVFDGRRRKW
jgi:hypothetical protein